MSLLSDSNQRVLTDPHYKCGAIDHYAKKAKMNSVTNEESKIKNLPLYITNSVIYFGQILLSYYYHYYLEVTLFYNKNS